MNVHTLVGVNAVSHADPSGLSLHSVAAAATQALANVAFVSQSDPTVIQEPATADACAPFLAFDFAFGYVLQNRVATYASSTSALLYVQLQRNGILEK